MSKGEATRERILDHAIKLASRDGLEGLTVGTLATELGLSKSGLFAHFGSKDSLQIQVLQTTAQRFEDYVVRPSLKAPRGEPRIRAFVDRWLAWAGMMPGGCVFVAASIELDDRPGPARDLLAATQRQWLATISKAAQIGIDAGQFRKDLNTEQFAYELYGAMLAYHHVNRLLQDPRAEERVRAAVQRLILQARA